MKKSRLKVIIISVLCIIECFVIFLMWKSTSVNETLLENVNLENNNIKENNKSNLAIMLGDKDGVYTESNDLVLPSNLKYHYNAEKSGCIDVNGNEIANAISYDNQTSMVTVTSNKTAYCYMYFELDGVAPQEFEFYLGGQLNPDYTNNSIVDVYINYTDSDVSHYCVIEENSSNNCEWVETNSSPINTTYTLFSGDGLKTVYAYTKDLAGNISDVVSDSITLDSTAPSSNSISINSNDAYTTSTGVTLTLSSSGATKMCISNSSSCSSYVNYTTSYSWTLASGLGSKTVYVYFKDDAGNVSSAATDTINLFSAISTVPSQSGTLTYSGSAQSPSWSNYSSTQLTLGGTTSKTDAGTYTATFTPKTNYIWSDGSTSAKNVNWTIGKAAGSLTLSSSSATLNVGASTNVTVTRAGSGTISATSNATGVATVSVSGTTITITGKASGTATITVKVAEGTNHKVPSNKTISVTVNQPAGTYILNSLKPSGLNTTIEGGLYRFQGASNSVNNYICFGTTDKSTCTNDTDKYMYRIIGISSDGQLKLIKKEALNDRRYWNSSTVTDIAWSSSDLYKGLNGSYFLSNTTYVPSAWSSKIATTSWKYGDNINTNVTAENLYATENGWTSTVSAKIGLMYAHDYAFAYQSGGLNCSTSGTYSTCKNAWISLWLEENDSNFGLYSEWTMSRYGYSSRNSYYYAWYISVKGELDYNTLPGVYAVRPVFFLTPDISYIGGTGTASDPILIN